MRGRMVVTSWSRFVTGSGAIVMSENCSQLPMSTSIDGKQVMLIG